MQLTTSTLLCKTFFNTSQLKPVGNKLRTIIKILNKKYGINTGNFGIKNCFILQLTLI